MAVYMGDVGTRLEFDIGIDIGEVASASLVIKKPSRIKVSKDLQKDTDKNLLYYITQDGDLDEVGIYTLQARVNLKSGWSGGAEIVKLEILDTI